MSTIKVSTLQNAGSANPNITLDTAGNATVGGTLAMGSSFLRNAVINGSMAVWQRGTSFTNPTVGGGNFYTADRWGVNRAGDVTGATVSQSTSVPAGFQYSLNLQRTAANTSAAGLYLFYSAETVDSLRFQGKNVTLSFYAKAGANYSGGALTVSVNTGTGTNERVYAYTGSASVISTTQAITTTWTRYTFTTSSAVASNINEIGFNISWTPTGTAGADDAVYLTGFQLEEGSVATPFERRQYGQELALCYRYYQQYSGNQKMLGHGYMGSATAMYRWGFALNIEMRAAPTLAFNGDVRVWGGSGPTTASATSTIGASYTQTNFVDADISCAGVTTTVGLVGKLIMNTTTASVSLSAEL